MCDLLRGHADLIDEFAGFLLPHQAQECGCLMTNLEFQRARTFLRQLEVNIVEYAILLKQDHCIKVGMAREEWWKEDYIYMHMLMMHFAYKFIHHLEIAI